MFIVFPMGRDFSTVGEICYVLAVTYTEIVIRAELTITFRTANCEVFCTNLLTNLRVSFGVSRWNF